MFPAREPGAKETAQVKYADPAWCTENLQMLLPGLTPLKAAPPVPGPCSAAAIFSQSHSAGLRVPACGAASGAALGVQWLRPPQAEPASLFVPLHPRAEQVTGAAREGPRGWAGPAAEEVMNGW